MQQFGGILIKKDKNTLASMQIKVRVMHYTDNNEEVFLLHSSFAGS